MKSPLLDAEVFDRASKLINALLEDREQVIELIMKAQDSLDTYHTRQTRRTYYWNLKRSQRSKVLLPEVELFQYLVYLHTEGVEVEQEREYLNGMRQLNEHTFILRYIKCLLCNCIPHKSFHLTIGLSRILYNYK